MNRRSFLQSSAALGAATPAGSYLEAIAAEELPLRIPVPMGATGPIVEIRTYLPMARPQDAVFGSAEFNFAWLDEVTLLLNFASLEARDRQWARFASLNTLPLEVKSLAIFRLVNC